MEKTVYFKSEDGQRIISARITELKLLQEKLEAEIDKRKTEMKLKQNVGSNAHYVYNSTTGLNKKVDEIKNAIIFSCNLIMRTEEHNYQLES